MIGLSWGSFSSSPLEIRGERIIIRINPEIILSFT